MKWYQPIECDKTVKNPLVCNFDNLEQFGLNENNFKEGKYIKEWNENIFLQAKEKKNDGEPDDALQNHLMLPVYSLRLIYELNKADIEGIQYLPLKLLKSNGDYLDGFCIANILNLIEAFDEKKSDFNCFSEDFPNPNVRGKIAGVKKFVLKKEKLIGLNIIRLKEYKQRFFVSEKFKDIFQNNSLTGYSFKEVELV
jgi:hypothetical protein